MLPLTPNLIRAGCCQDVLGKTGQGKASLQPPKVQGKTSYIFLPGSCHLKLPSCQLSQVICSWSKLSRKMTVGVPSPCPVQG